MKISTKASDFESEFYEGDGTEIISSPIILMRTRGLCSACQNYSIVYALSGYWRGLGYVSLADIETMPAAVKNVIPTKVKESYFFNNSEKSFVNHCMYCRSVILDRDLFHSGDAFSPLSYKDVDYIKFYQLPVDGAFEFVTGWSANFILLDEIVGRSVSLSEFH